MFDIRIFFYPPSLVIDARFEGERRAARESERVRARESYVSLIACYTTSNKKDKEDTAVIRSTASRYTEAPDARRDDGARRLIRRRGFFIF